MIKQQAYKTLIDKNRKQVKNDVMNKFKKIHNKMC